ncbi:hypothetical protein C5167_047346 [Papaver somniferum]|uniref:Uncharacterized protein n=1 Tax=Papaver somniferum TaxID=3469 RepID=A0A4Y7LKA2_PAPSO|nr:hypothetical protein C5167_047346 [Papaver somniferum]
MEAEVQVSSPRDMANSRMWLETNLPKMAKVRTSNATISMVFMIKITALKKVSDPPQLLRLAKQETQISI